MKDRQITHEDAAEALDSMDDYARMEVGVDAIGPRGLLERYIEQQRNTYVNRRYGFKQVGDTPIRVDDDFKRAQEYINKREAR